MSAFAMYTRPICHGAAEMMQTPDTQPKPRRGGSRPGAGRKPQSATRPPAEQRYLARKWVTQDEEDAIDRLLDSLRMPRRDPEEQFL